MVEGVLLFALHPPEFKHVKFAETSCPYGTIGLSVYYRPSITLPDRLVVELQVTGEEFLVDIVLAPSIFPLLS